MRSGCSIKEILNKYRRAFLSKHIRIASPKNFQTCCQQGQYADTYFFYSVSALKISTKVFLFGTNELSVYIRGLSRGISQLKLS